MSSRHKLLDLSKVQTTSIRKRECLLHADMLGETPDPAGSLKDFYRSLPRLGESLNLIEAADALTHAALAEKNIFWLIDSTVIEAGLSNLIVKMIQRGLIRGIAMTGTAAIRDYELAFFGMTHEDERKGLGDGLYGMSREAGEGVNDILNEGVRRGFGLGECLGRGILDRQPRYFTKSILAACTARMVPCTIHVQIGADGIHRHPSAEGHTLGKGSMKDMQILSARIRGLNEGGALVAAHRDPALRGVLYNAYAQSRNLDHTIENFSVIRFGEDSPDFSALPGVAAEYVLPGPIELMAPLFTGVLFSMVE